MAERIIQFEGRQIAVPADATDDEVSGILSSQPAAAPQPSTVETIMGAANGLMGGAKKLAMPTEQFGPEQPQPDGGGIIRQTISGLGRGASNLLGLPVDAVNNAPRVLNLIPGVDGIGKMSDRPFAGGDSIYDAIFRLGGALPETPEPVTGGEKFMRRVGEEIGAAVVPAAGALATAARVGVEGARKLPGLARMFVEPAAVNPTNFVRKEATVAAGAGTGAAAANQRFDPNTTSGKIADIVGAVLGAGVTGAGSALARGGRDLAAAATGNPNYASRVVGERAADELVQASDIMGRQVDPSNLKKPLDTQTLIDAISRPAQAETAIPGFKASTADRAGDQGLASLEAARAKSNAGAYNTRMDENAAAVDAAVGKLQPTETPGAFRDELVVQRDRKLAETAMLRQAAEDEAARATQPLQPASTPAQRGDVVRSGINDAFEQARAKTDAAYADVNISGRQVDPAPLTESLDQTIGGLTQVERGFVPQGTIDRVSALGRETPGADGAPGVPPSPIALKEATDLKSELQRLQRAALADPTAEKGGRNAARVLGQMLDTVDGFISRNLSPEEIDKLGLARDTKRAEADAFTRQGDPVAQATARYEGGNNRVRDDRVAGLFVDPQSMDRLFKQVDTPQVRQAIRDEVLSRGDLSSAERVDRFVTDYGQQIDKFPGLRDELTRAGAARRGEASARGSETALQRELGTDTQPGRGPVGKYLQYSDANAERAMKEVLAAKDPAKAADELLNFAGNDPKAVEGARAAFWKNLESASRSKNAGTETKAGTMPIIGRKLVAFLDDPRNASVAERLYKDSPEHLNNLKEIGNALREVGVGRKNATAANPSGTALMARGDGVSLAEAGSKFYQVQIGRVSPLYVLAHLAGRVASSAVGSQRQKVFENLLDQALRNPDAAAALLKENNPANRAAMARKAKGWLGNEASTLVDMLDTEEDDVKAKVMEKQ